MLTRRMMTRLAVLPVLHAGATNGSAQILGAFPHRLRIRVAGSGRSVADAAGGMANVPFIRHVIARLIASAIVQLWIWQTDLR